MPLLRPGSFRTPVSLVLELRRAREAPDVGRGEPLSLDERRRSDGAGRPHLLDGASSRSAVTFSREIRGRTRGVSRLAG
jgi:hypothetical protein